MCVKGIIAGNNFILYRLFDVTPEVQQVFPKFKDVPRDQLESNTAYKSHTLNVVKTVQKAIDSLNDIPALSEKLQKLGKRHISYGISGSEPFDVSVNNTQTMMQLTVQACNLAYT